MAEHDAAPVDPDIDLPVPAMHPEQRHGVPGDGVPGDGVPGDGVPGQGVPSHGVQTHGVPGHGVPVQGLHASVLAAVSAGGVVGALARYALATAWPHAPRGFPWSTFVINVTGCFLIGILMVIVTEVVTHRPLLRPFLGVGVLGGYTTFSTYVVDIQRTAGEGAALTALGYLALTLIGALLAVYTGTVLTRAAVRR